MSIVRYQPAKILSGAVEANGMVYVAGTVADKRPASVKAQTEEILGRIDARLAQAGSHKSKIVSAQIWLAPELDPERVVLGRREDVEQAPADRELAASFDHVDPGVRGGHESFDDVVEVSVWDPGGEPFIT